VARNRSRWVLARSEDLTQASGTEDKSSDDSGRRIRRFYVCGNGYRPHFMHNVAETPKRLAARESNSETGLYYYRARYYDTSIGRFMSEDSSQQGVQGDEVDLYRYALNSPTNFVDSLGLSPAPATFTIPSYLPLPSLPIEALLECITYKTGIPLLVTSTSEKTWRHPPESPHGRGDAVDLNYPANPANADKILCAASFCGAGFGLDEKKHPSPNSTGDHLHLQIPPGTRGGHGDLPKPTCLGCGSK
jgi:RHS repeat-associated protein